MISNAAAASQLALSQREKEQVELKARFRCKRDLYVYTTQSRVSDNTALTIIFCYSTGS